MWRRGLALGEIAAVLKCSIYDLSPWIYKADLDAFLEQASNGPAGVDQPQENP